ncbi:hypothetical protein Tco_0034414 [Tanacetum coccineum]
MPKNILCFSNSIVQETYNPEKDEKQRQNDNNWTRNEKTVKDKAKSKAQKFNPVKKDPTESQLAQSPSQPQSTPEAKVQRNISLGAKLPNPKLNLTEKRGKEKR